MAWPVYSVIWKFVFEAVGVRGVFACLLAYSVMRKGGLRWWGQGDKLEVLRSSIMGQWSNGIESGIASITFEDSCWLKQHK